MSRRLLAALVAVSVATSGLTLSHLAARTASASTCDPYACSTFEVTFSGPGSAYATDAESEISCSWDGSVRTGTCSHLYYWIDTMYPNGYTVTVTATAAANTYVCIDANICSPAGGSRSYGAVLDKGVGGPGYASMGWTANLAKTFAFQVSSSGDGNGSIMSTPAGINCTVTGGTSSGTCAKTWYFASSFDMTVTATPAKGTYLCVQGASCLSVGTPFSRPYSAGSSVSPSIGLEFHLGHPIVSVHVSGQGSVASTPGGISCSTSCSAYFLPSSTITLNAAAKSGSVFSAWTGSCAGYGPICNLALGTTDVSTTAVFAVPATPRPSASTGPTARPSPTASPGATVVPGPTRTPAATAAPPSGTTSPEPASAAPGGPTASSGGPGGPAASTAGSVATASTGPSSDATPAPSVEPAGAVAAGDAGVDPAWIVAIVALVVAALAVGLLIGRRGGRGAERA